MEINARLIAKILINKCHELDREITNLKLQKLLYFAQGHYMQENEGNPLFEDDFQAWAHGPVVPDVYSEYKDYSWFNLPKQKNVEEVSNEIDIFLVKLLKNYGSAGGKQLEIISHDEQPWLDARGNLNPYAPSKKPISKDSIRKYYALKGKLNAII